MGAISVAKILKVFSIVWKRAIWASDKVDPDAWKNLVLLSLALSVGMMGLIHANSVIDQQSISRSNPSVWELAWSDEFNGPSGSSVDSTKWAFETGGNGWGNNELETYTNRSTNASLEGGSLVIKALKETLTGPDNITRNYTSARLTTRQMLLQANGRLETRIKIPEGQGIWPAFWMLGDNIGTAGWPNCGEIDIMENIGREPSAVHGTAHGPGYSVGNGVTAAYTLPNGRKFSDDFHTVAVEWEPNAMRFYVDGLLYRTRTRSELPPNTKWVFDQPFFISLSLAVGGSMSRNPSPLFPQAMTIDYVRVYQRGPLSSSTLLLVDPPANSILFWVWLFSTLGTSLGAISTIILAWISNNRAKAELILKQAEASIKAREAELKAREAELKVREAELRVKELEDQLRNLERDRSLQRRLIVVKD